MTITDLIRKFRLFYELGSLALPGFEDSEIKELLQAEQYKLINQKFGGNNLYREAFPDSSKRIDDLQGLIKEDTELTLSDIASSNSAIATLPTDFLHMVELRAEIVDGDATTYEICEQIDSKYEYKFNSSYRNSSPVLNRLGYLFINTNSGDRLVRIYYDEDFPLKDSSDTISCLYIKTPTDLTTVGSATLLIDYDEGVYGELVRSTVDYAISIVSPQKSQVSQQQLNKTE